MESCPQYDAFKSAVSPPLYPKTLRQQINCTPQRDAASTALLKSIAAAKGTLLAHCVHVSMVLKQQLYYGIMAHQCSRHECSVAFPADKTPQAADDRTATRSNINNVTQVNSRIKGALLVRCIHVSTVLKEQENYRICRTCSSQFENSVASPAKKTTKATEKCQTTRRSINSMTQVDSGMKGELLVR